MSKVGFANKQELKNEVVAPILTKASWRSETVARTLNPERLARLLQSAVEEYSSEYLTPAEEMEEKDLHYAGVLGVRKPIQTTAPRESSRTHMNPRTGATRTVPAGVTPGFEWNHGAADLRADGEGGAHSRARRGAKKHAGLF